MSLLLVLLASAVPAARASPPRVTCTHTKPVVLGADVTLTCEFKAQLDVLQVTWQKKMGKDSQNMVTYSEKYGINIAKPFKELLTVTNTSSTNFSIKISKLEKEDATCYNCLFNAYPNGAFTGEVCLTDPKLANEVLCTARGSDLRILLTPPEIQTRQPAQFIEEKSSGAEVTVKGQYSDITINPTCEFEREKRQRRNVCVNQSNSADDGEKKFVSTQCKASGKQKFEITWHNVGEPFSREDTLNTTDNLITVTSTLIYIASSLPANHKCSIDPPLEEDPEKAGMTEPTLGSVINETNEAQEQHYWMRHVTIICAAALLQTITILILFYKALWRREAKIPKKLSKAENGLLTPKDNCDKMLDTETTDMKSPESSMSDSGIGSPLSPLNSTSRVPEESMESSVMKSPTSERTRLDMSDILDEC